MLQHLEARAPAYNVPKVSPAAFLGTIWALTILSFLFLPTRLYARWSAFRRFYWDDFFVLFAWTLSLAITASCTAYNHVTYEIMLIGAGQMKFPANVKVIVMQFSRLFTVVPMLFYTGLWSIKIAFLLFFRRLGTQQVTSLRRLWWTVAGVTGVCYLACFASLPYRCCLVSYEVLASRECSQQQGLSFTSMKVNCVLDVFTDLLIMAIPFAILRHVRLSKRQRIALSGIFSLVVVTIVFAVVRAAITTIGVTNQMDPVWMYLWTNVELNVAIIVACVAPYRTLFLRSHAPPQHLVHRPAPQRASSRSWKVAISKVLSLSSGKTRSTAAPNQWSTDDLPYLAPWVSNGGDEPEREMVTVRKESGRSDEDESERRRKEDNGYGTMQELKGVKRPAVARMYP